MSVLPSYINYCYILIGFEVLLLLSFIHLRKKKKEKSTTIITRWNSSEGNKGCGTFSLRLVCNIALLVSLPPPVEDDANDN